MDFSRLKKPVFIIDKPKALRNLERMAQKARESGVSLRPHVKTHQSAGVAAWLRDFGISRLSVSSVDMAAYFLAAGWRDLLITVPVNVHQIPDIDRLAAEATVHILVESARMAAEISSKVTRPLNVWIEVDTGYHRTGIAADRHEDMIEVASIIARDPNLRLRGLLGHDGQAYCAEGPAGVRAVFESSLRSHRGALEALGAAGFPDLRLSIGDTPTCSLVGSFPAPVAEIRPGNFLFYDLTQLAVGACSEDDIAATVACPVIAKYPQRREIVLYGGGVHISKEALRTASGRTSYGSVARLCGNQGRWTASVPGVSLSSLSQEQGTVSGPDEFIASVGIGESLAVLPVHSCLTANLHPAYFVEGEGWLTKFHL